MKKLVCIMVGTLLLSLSGIANATTYVENFEAPFPAWESGWLGTNSNLTNYYGQGGGRGNNPDGLWIGATPIVFNSTFGALLTSLSIDVASWTSTNLVVYDIAGSSIFSGPVVPNYGAYTDPGTYQHFSVSSSNGISEFAFIPTSSVLGNLSIDNVVVSTDAAPVPEPSTLLLLGAGLAGTVLLRRRIKG